MDSKKTFARTLGSGIYNLDTNVVREYPNGPGSRRFTETVLDYDAIRILQVDFVELDKDKQLIEGSQKTIVKY